MEQKLRDAQFKADIGPLLSADFEWNAEAAAALVQASIIERLTGDPWRRPG